MSWSTAHVQTPFGPLGEKLSFVQLSPTVTGQRFLNQETKARSFLELRVSKGVPIFSGGLSQASQASDDWSFAPGFGLQSAVAERLNLGGAADYWFTLRTIDGRPDEISTGTSFRAFLQYRL